jgi:hypothetical protein
MCGCFAEYGVSSPASRDAIVGWARDTIQQAFDLHQRVCAELPMGELSKRDVFEEKRKALRTIFPTEARALSMAVCSTTTRKM